MDGCGKYFAVVFFVNENIYSEIPVSWLTEDRKQCWWPNIINPRNKMIKGEKPNSDDDTTWTLHEIVFETYASTLESARKKAENSDYVTGNEEVLGPRQRKQNHIHSTSSDSEVITPPPTPSVKNKKKKASKKSLKTIAKKINENNQNRSPESNEDNLLVVWNPESGFISEIPSQTNYSLRLPSAGSIPKEVTKETVEENVNQTAMVTEGAKTSDVSIIISKENASLQDLHEEIQRISITCNKMERYLLSIDKRLNALILEKGNLEFNKDLDTLMAQLPCKTNEDVEQLDEKVINNLEFKQSFIQYMKRVGGKDVKDNINRCLPCLFTNELGTHCSYVGFRGNLKLQNFAFMKLLVEMVVLQHQCTLHEVEKCIGEWFRLSNQRLKRGKK